MLSKYLNYVVVGIMVVLLTCIGIEYVVISKKTAEIENLKVQKQELTVKLKDALAINEGLNAKIDLQNQAIQQLNLEKQELDQRLQQAKQEVKNLTQKNQQTISAIMKEKVSNDCESAIGWLKEKALKLKNR